MSLWAAIRIKMAERGESDDRVCVCVGGGYGKREVIGYSLWPQTDLWDVRSTAFINLEI